MVPWLVESQRGLSFSSEGLQEKTAPQGDEGSPTLALFCLREESMQMRMGVGGE
jgi:hypothetical protein